MKRYLLILTIAIFTVFSLTCCKTKDSNKDTAKNKEESTVEPSNLETTDPENPDFLPADKKNSDDNTDKKDEPNQTSTPNNKKDNTQDSNATIFKDYMDTQEYKVKASGTYEFTCNPSDNTAYWDIYVLNEPFDDALRYLTSAHNPTLKVTKKPTTYKLKKGQYVYCSCSQNALTFEGDSKTFSCPLSIKYIK